MSEILVATPAWREIVVNNNTLSNKTQLESEIQTFSGAAKQYVRSEGWLKPIKELVSRRAKAGITTPFKYFTLPGPQMTDIGVLWNAGLIEPIDGKVNIAICDREHANRVVIQMGELGVELLGSDKKVLHEALKRKNGPLRQLFPFDVINLDLCNALVTGSRKYSNLDALLWMFRFQRGQRFLLLLTTRANEKFDIDLVRLLQHNYESEPGFNEAYETLIQQTAIDPYQNSTFFSRLVFPKLIAKYAFIFGYKVTEHFAAYYSRPMGNQGRYDMLAHTFELEPLKPTTERETFFPCFEKVPENEHHNKTRILLATEHRQRAVLAYATFVKGLPTNRFVNIDQLLSENTELKAAMESEEEALSGWWKRSSFPIPS